MALRFLTAGESHGPALVAILEGLPAGLPLPVEVIDRELKRRQEGIGAGPRRKIEQDQAQILGGVMAGVTTGGPLAIWIENKDHAKWRGKPVPPFTIPRPGHVDLTAAIKYGYRDLRPGLERASARETAARVAIGAVCRHFLAQFGIRLGGYVLSIGEVRADVETIPLEERFEIAEGNEVRCPDSQAAQQMQVCIQQVMREKDTLGGVIEAIALHLPAGLGSHVHWDRRLEARLGAALLSIPAVKGIEIGPAFENSARRGSQVQDAISLEGQEIVRPTDRCGGIEGGITTGQPLTVRAAMKPIATTLTPQHSVDLNTGQETDTHYERSDFCPVPRAVVVVEAMLAFVLAEALIEKLGGDSLVEMQSRFQFLRHARLEDLQMDNTGQEWWPA